VNPFPAIPYLKRREEVMTATPLDVVGSIRYLTLLLADQPRRIDTVINYFGGTSSDSDPRPTRWQMRARRDGRPAPENASTARSA